MDGADDTPTSSDHLLAQGTPPARSSRSSLLAPLRDPVVVILALAGIFDGISGNPIHSILLLAVAIALGRDAVRRGGLPEPREDRSHAPLSGQTPLPAGLLLLAVALSYAVVIGGFSRYSWPLTVAVIAPGAMALALAWRGPLNTRPEPEPLQTGGVAVWASLFVALGLWELTSLLLQPSLTTDSYAHPTISVLTDPILATHPGRSIFLFCWLALGWFLAQR